MVSPKSHELDVNIFAWPEVIGLIHHALKHCNEACMLGRRQGSVPRVLPPHWKLGLGQTVFALYVGVQIIIFQLDSISLGTKVKLVLK